EVVADVDVSAVGEGLGVFPEQMLRGAGNGEVRLLDQHVADVRRDAIPEGEAFQPAVDDEAESGQPERVVVSERAFDRLPLLLDSVEEVRDRLGLQVLEAIAQPGVDERPDAVPVARGQASMRWSGYARRNWLISLRLLLYAFPLSVIRSSV